MEKSVQPVNYTNITNQTVKQEMSGYNPAYHDELPGYNHTYRSRTADERMDEFRELMSNIVGRAIALNNEELSQQISTDVQERILKEMNYLMREQDSAQEEKISKEIADDPANIQATAEATKTAEQLMAEKVAEVVGADFKFRKL